MAASFSGTFVDNIYKCQHIIRQNWADQGLVDWILLISYASSRERLESLIRP